MEIIQYLKQQEGKTLEFKRDLSSPDKVLRTVAAFTNTAGGVLLIGVEDGTRAVRGVTHPLEEEERLANLIADGISPQVVPDIEILPWRKTYILSLRIHPGSNRPYFLRKLGPDKGVFIRVGSTNRVADRHMVDELRRLVRNESFDELPMTDLNSEAVDFRAASECFEPVRRLRGSGIQRMIRACLDAGQEEPRFEEVGMHFRVTLCSESQKESIPDQVEERILTALRERKDLSTKEIADLIDRSPRAARTRMIGLMKRGLVVEIGTDPRDPRKRYTLSKGT